MSLILTIIAVSVGIALILVVMKTMKNKQMSAPQSLLWLLSGIIIIFFGLFPSVVTRVADLLGIWWAPSVLLFGASVILAFISFNHAKEISVFRAQITELTEQVSVLKYELAEKEIIHKGSREN